MRDGRPRPPWLGLVLALGLLGMAMAGSGLVPLYPTTQNLDAVLAPPGPGAPLGTDDLGRDVLARVVAGAPLSLGVALAASVATAALGASAGLFAAARGGAAEWAVMALADLAYAVPSLLVVLLAAGLFGNGIGTVLPALVLSRWPGFARACHPLARAALAAPAAEASLLLGFGAAYRMRRHAWPAVRPTLASLAALGVGANVLAVASLGFIGIGLAPPRPEWGAMVAEALPTLRDAPLAALAPAAAVFAATLAATLIGESWAERDGAETAP